MVNTPYNMERRADEAARLEAFATKHQLTNFTVNTRDEFREPSGILNFAQEVKADLIAMGTHGRRGLAHLFAGSITEQVVNHVESPMWTYSTHR